MELTSTYCYYQHQTSDMDFLMDATKDGLESTKLYLLPIQQILDASNGIKYVGIFSILIRQSLRAIQSYSQRTDLRMHFRLLNAATSHA
jgi:hypothetical protein